MSTLKPNYYNTDGIDVITFCYDRNINFNLGNAIKYIVRAGKKNPNTEVEDLAKAKEYLSRELEFL